MRFHLPLLLLMLCCSAETPPKGNDAATPSQISEPAPGTTPRPSITGNIDVKTLKLNELETVDGCSVLLVMDGGNKGDHVLAMGYPGRPAEMILGGVHQILAFETEQTDETGAVTYRHANERYRVVTEIMSEAQLAPELRAVSGTVHVTDRDTGEESLITVTGEQGC